MRFVPVSAAEQVASVHALAPGKAYDITFALQSRTMTVRTCDLLTRAGSTLVQPFATVASKNIGVANPTGGSTTLGLHMETNATALAFAGDFVIVNGQLTAVDGSGTDHAGGNVTFTPVPLPAALIPSGLPVC